jgi:hypothetical protein
MLTIQQIIDEADLLVPNSYQLADKVNWLNKINSEFFENVKIPVSTIFMTTLNQSSYLLPNEVRGNNIDHVQLGLLTYSSMNYEDVRSSQIFYIFDDSTHKITFYPEPYAAAQQTVVRYHRIATSSFTTGTLSAKPDAPGEYHWIYVNGLCERIAKANGDVEKANNYGNDYRNGLATAAKNFAKLGD